LNVFNMQKEQVVKQVVEEQGILPLFYNDNIDVCLAITRSLYNAGIRCIEFTNRGGQALNNFKHLVKARDSDMKDMLLAIGTIKTGDDASRFIDAGADCLISPVFDSTVCDVAYLNKVLWIPGCMTPTEIDVAQKAGCTTLKLFPGNVLGPGFVEAIQPLFTGLKYVVTGGVDITEESLRTWFKAGVAGVGLGSKLITRQVIESNSYKELQTSTENILSIIQKLKSK
jgi:2-dehydro-3-deoxyphosphogluconate aldolase / (4S)-4-hydroxy-2-oxoglutarate aldolase